MDWGCVFVYAFMSWAQRKLRQINWPVGSLVGFDDGARVGICDGICVGFIDGIFVGITICAFSFHSQFVIHKEASAYSTNIKIQVTYMLGHVLVKMLGGCLDYRLEL